MKIISGGQTGVDRAALDLAIERGLDWGGWCPKGGWAEDSPHHARTSRRISAIEGNPSIEPAPAYRMECTGQRRRPHHHGWWRDGGLRGHGTRPRWAHQHGKPELVVDATDTKAQVHAASWLDAQRKRFGSDMILSIGGPRESEAPGIYTLAKVLIAAILDRAR